MLRCGSEYAEAIQRHQRSVAAHETIIQVLRAVEQQAITEVQAIARLEAAAASEGELGLVAACHASGTSLGATRAV